jgi:hypothetical protein
VSFGSFRYGFINYKQANSDADTPTLFRLSGSMPKSLVTSTYNKLALFFDSAVDLTYFIDQKLNYYSCSLGEVNCHAY